ncbi:hypothetical protein Metho_1498 [Methanomethylovorans hollandica DSM 15978]|uniref:Uncharacterized protein n=1 Tax=Methanomethylovorans hollandica (strain DSM 15978 / NBRC 107637 / DMS1) TaxID=867904 RepID=L0KW66_METHD|nr:hypothetical protein [Methanomethylovorans hollandica]AGB49702.1 hypothetical protein Metho_1498 [Methanomethylovorans hollandica DSM 15978]
MKLFKYALLLIVLVGFVSVAEAAHTHVFTGTMDPKEPTQFIYGSLNIIDTITVDDASGKRMVFHWYYDPIGGPIEYRGFTEDDTIDNKKFSAGLYTGGLDKDGRWRVHAIEYKMNGKIKEESDAYFIVAPLPEFPIGSCLLIFIVGFLYLTLRRNMAVY